MWRARPLSDTAPPKAVPLTHGEARGGVTWTNAVDDEENERRPPEKNSRIFGAGVLYDSVIANTGAAGQVHRELIVYDRRQAYPEYIVTYREY